MRAIVVTFVGSAFAALLWTACLKKSAFNCADSTACGTGGVCEPEGFCSVSNSTCDSGRAFSDTAGGGLAGQCVGGGNPIDAPAVDPDGPEPDTAMPPTGCPDAAYQPIAGGTTGHRYKLVSTTDDWVAQHNLPTGCLVSGGYLAIPNDAAELGAFETLAAGVDAWVGVSDRDGGGANEGVFQDVFNVLYTTPAGITLAGNKMQDDCALMTSATTLDIKGCAENHIAICECEEN